MKKISLTIGILFSILCFSSCFESFQQQTYSDIEYYSDGTELILEPSKYRNGAEVVLPIPSNNGYNFLGWYQNESLTGSAVTKILSTDTGKKIFYAKWEKAFDYSVEHAYSVEDNTYVNVEAYITSVEGNNIVVDDKTNALYVKFDTVDYYKDKYAIGKNVLLYGKKLTTNGLEYLDMTGANATFEALGKSFMVETLDATNLNDSFFKTNLCKKVNVKDVEINSLFVKSALTNDVGFTISQGDVVTKCIVKNYSKALTGNDFSVVTYPISTKVDLLEVIISYNGSYILEFTDESILQPAYNESGVKLATNLLLSYQSISCTKGTLLQELLESQVVTCCYNDGTREVIDSTKYKVTSTLNPDVLGTYEATISYEDISVTFMIQVVESSDSVIKTDTTTTQLKDVLNAGKYDLALGMPSTGNSKALVIPVAFTDYPAKANMVTSLNTAFFGTSAETGWESLSSYYEKVSYGQLHISGKVMPVFQTGHSSTYYFDQYQKNDNYLAEDIVKAALDYYDSQIDYSTYDSDSNGYIDSLYLVYTAPVDYTNYSLWWAVTTEYITDKVEPRDNVEADFYTFLGYEFLFEKPASGKSLVYNAETIIHETGHILGCDDYYDYKPSIGPSGGAACSIMMDANVGDFDSYSKSILGWIHPSVVTTTSASITLRGFAQSGDALIIAKNWSNSFYSEYFIIDYYTPTGVNEMEKGYSGLYTIPGVRIYHVMADLNKENTGNIWQSTLYNNTDTNYKLLSLVEADGGTNTAKSKNSDLFQVNNIITNLKWYSQSTSNFKITIDSMTPSSVTLSVTF